MDIARELLGSLLFWLLLDGIGLAEGQSYLAGEGISQILVELGVLCSQRLFLLMFLPISAR